MKVKYLLAAIFALIAIILVAISFINILPLAALNILTIIFEWIPAGLISVVIICGFGIAISHAIEYLSNVKHSDKDSLKSEEYDKLHRELDTLKMHIAEINLDAIQSKGDIITDADLTEIKRQVLEVSSEDAVAALKDSFLNKLRYIEQNKKTNVFFNNVISRLRQAIINIERRASVSLVFGIAFAVIGIAILGYTLIVVPDYIATKDPNDFLIAYYLPRISTALLIELLAYFFLNLYKVSFDEIKYFHNEITNIELKFISADFAADNGLMLKELSNALINTDRNEHIVLSQLMQNKKSDKKLDHLSRFVEACVSHKKP